MGRKKKKAPSERNTKQTPPAAPKSAAPAAAPAAPAAAPAAPKPEPAKAPSDAPSPKKAQSPDNSTPRGGAPLLELRDLKTWFYTDEGIVKAVNGVNLKIREGETLGIVGESACGKSVTAYSIMRLIPNPPGRIVGGQILFRGRDLATIPEDEMRKIRGKEIAMIFQEPMSSLNPVFTVGDQLSEVLILHRGMSKSEAWEESGKMLAKVGIPEPSKRLHNYPHEMSGGMKQRVMIAMALACNPALLLADEPTTALDVTIQAQILDLMRRLQSEIGMSIWFITHDLGVIAELAHQVAVMYASRVVETASVTELFENPRHPYTRGLFQSLPKLGAHQSRLSVIPGQVPNPLRHPSGCRFHTRCEFVIEDCKSIEPELHDFSPGHQVACIRVERGEQLFEV